MLKHPNVSKTKIVSLLTILEEVPDPRVARSREHDLVELLVIALCTLLCMGDSFYDMEEFARAPEVAAHVPHPARGRAQP